MATRSLRLRSLTQLRLPELVARVLQSPWTARTQRIGKQTLHRVSLRYPAVAHLLDRSQRSLRDGAGAALLDRFGLTWPVARASAATPSAAPAPSAAPPAAEASADAFDADGTVYDTGTAHHEASAPEAEAVASLFALRDGLSDSEWGVRMEAVLRWGVAAGPGAVPYLVTALSDGSAEVAASAAECLGTLGVLAASETRDEITLALRNVLADAEGYWSPVTRAAAAEALVRCIGAEGTFDDAALARIDEALGDIDAEVSLATIAALAQLPATVATPRLLRLLGDESGYFIATVRVAAASALMGVGLDESRRADLMARERDAEVRSILGGAAAPT